LNPQANGDEFADMFDNLSPSDFTPLRTATFPSEGNDFAEFLASRIDAARTAFKPGRDMLHVALANGDEIRQLAPWSEETAPAFIKRTTRNASDMMAISLFFCNLTNKTTPVGAQCATWFASYIENGDQVMRMGLIEVVNGQLGASAEITNLDVLAAAGAMLGHILMP